MHPIPSKYRSYHEPFLGCSPLSTTYARVCVCLRRLLRPNSQRPAYTPARTGRILRHLRLRAHVADAHHDDVLHAASLRLSVQRAQDWHRFCRLCCVNNRRRRFACQPLSCQCAQVCLAACTPSCPSWTATIHPAHFSFQMCGAQEKRCASEGRVETLVCPSRDIQCDVLTSTAHYSCDSCF